MQHSTFSYLLVRHNTRGAFERIYAIETNDALAHINQQRDDRKSSTTRASTHQPQILPNDSGLLKAAKPGRYALNILHINDFHNKLITATPGTGGQSETGSAVQTAPATPDILYSPLARIGSQVLQARRTTRCADLPAGPQQVTLFLSAGDDHVGSRFDALTTATGSESIQPVSTVYRGLSLAGLDAATLGNHEFDLSFAALNHIIATDAEFPVLSANIQIPGKRHHQAIIGLAGGLRIGIIGVTTLEELHIREDQAQGIIFEHPEQAVARLLPAMQPYCDVLVLLSHLGYNVPGSQHTVEYDDHGLAGFLEAACTLPWLIIGGHTHTILDHSKQGGNQTNLPIFQAGSDGQYYGRTTIQLSLDADPIAGHASPGFKSEILSTHLSQADQHFEETFFQNIINPATQSLEAEMERPLCRVLTDGTGSSKQTLDDRLSDESSVMNALTDAIAAMALKTLDLKTDQASDRIIAALDASGVQGGFDQEGEARVRHLYSILPYADSIHHAIVSGRDLLAILRSNAKRIVPRYRLKSQGGDLDASTMALAMRGFMQFSRLLRYSISFESGDQTITECRFMHTPLQQLADIRFHIFLNAHSALGFQGWGSDRQEQFHEFGACDITKLGFKDTHLNLKETVINYFSERSIIEVRKDQRLILH
jgi:2',3'-cyclic-nucleotide 2'-phosphodiesterase (5'-nucleotidase family)